KLRKPPGRQDRSRRGLARRARAGPPGLARDRRHRGRGRHPARRRPGRHARPEAGQEDPRPPEPQEGHRVTKKIVLAYSGGLDTSVLLKWIKDQYKVPVIAFVADIGQGDDMGAVSRKATKTGADKVVITDLREEFAREYVFTALKANAVYEGA